MDAQRFIDAIVEDPTALERWEVYADWLLERGDPRGELISLGLRGVASERIAELEHDEAHLLSPRLYDQSHLYRFEFRRSFIHGATLQGTADERPTVEAIDALFADPHGCLVERLELGPFGDLEHAVAALAAPRRALRTLSTIAGPDSSDRLALAAPQLERLEILDDRGGARIVHPTVATLVTDVSRCKSICSGAFDLPSLTALDLTFLDSRPLSNAESIWSRPPPRLTTLKVDKLTPDEWSDEAGDAYFFDMFAQLGTSPLGAQLQRLELGYLRSVEIGQLLAVARQLRRLQHLQFHVTESETLEERTAVRDAFVAAFPATTLEVDWRLEPPRPLGPAKIIDADSKGTDGRVDALGAFILRRVR